MFFSQRKNPEELFQQGNAFCSAGDHRRAAECYSQGAKMGHAPSQNEYGKLLQAGTGVSRDTAQAVCWFRKAAEQGYAPAQASLGVMLLLGSGTEQNHTEGVYWMNLALRENIYC